jgi:hypothetical protein
MAENIIALPNAGPEQEVAKAIETAQTMLARDSTRALALIAVTAGGQVEVLFAGHQVGWFHHLCSGATMLQGRLAYLAAVTQGSPT